MLEAARRWATYFLIGGAAFSAEGQISVTPAGGSTIIEVNTLGASGAEMAIELANGAAFGAANLVLTGNPNGDFGSDGILVGDGGDILAPFPAVDVIDGGGGEDYIYGGQLDDDLHGGADNDIVRSGPGTTFSRRPRPRRAGRLRRERPAVRRGRDRHHARPVGQRPARRRRGQRLPGWRHGVDRILGGGGDDIFGGSSGDQLTGGGGRDSSSGPAPRKGGTRSSTSSWVRTVSSSMECLRNFNGSEAALARYVRFVPATGGSVLQVDGDGSGSGTWRDLALVQGGDGLQARDLFLSGGLAIDDVVPPTPRPFEPLAYIASYDDLIQAFGANAAAGEQHYLSNGQAEGRSVTFDGLQYIASYGDLIGAFGANAAVGTTHYITNGFAEGRDSDNFNEVRYLANYADLQAAFGNDLEAATQHFITNGFAEGRTDFVL